MATTTPDPQPGDGPVITRNPAEAAGVPTAPARVDGSPWRFEMIYGGGSWRAYAHTPAALLEALIPGYQSLPTPTAAAEARIRLACDLQVRLQAQIAASADLSSCSPEQRAVLLGDFSTPPVLERWDGPVPLVLVATFYVPVGQIPAPQGDIIWLDPGDDWDLLLSLAHAGVLQIGAHEPEGGNPGSADPPPEDGDGRR